MQRLSPRLSAGNADSTLQIFKEQTADFHRAARARTLHRDLLLRSLERLLEQSTGQCVRVWWRMTGSNRRPPACKAGALPAELIPQDLQNRGDGGSGWSRTNDPRLIKTVL